MASDCHLQQASVSPASSLHFEPLLFLCVEHFGYRRIRPKSVTRARIIWGRGPSQATYYIWDTDTQSDTQRDTGKAGGAKLQPLLRVGFRGERAKSIPHHNLTREREDEVCVRGVRASVSSFAHYISQTFRFEAVLLSICCLTLACHELRGELRFRECGGHLRRHANHHLNVSDT